YGHGPRTADGIAGHVVEASAMTAAVLTANMSYSVACQTPKHHHELWSGLYCQAALIRDVFGNPFRTKPLVETAGQDRLIAQLAQAVYDDRKLPEGTLNGDLLAILADAVEEAGSTDGDLLAHLRSPGPHTRGCFA